jgi:type I restriction enzyme S subunit
MSWEKVRLRDICFEDKFIVDGKSSKMPYLGLEMIEAGTGTIDWNASTVAGVSTCYRFDVRHVLYGKLRPYLNKVALPDIEGRCSTEIMPLLPKENVCREFIAYLLRRQETIDYVIPEKSGSRMPRADMGYLMKMPVLLPSLDEQRRIAEEIERQLAIVDKAKKAAEEQVVTISALPAAILRQAFSDKQQEVPNE